MTSLNSQNLLKVWWSARCMALCCCYLLLCMYMLIRLPHLLLFRLLHLGIYSLLTTRTYHSNRILWCFVALMLCCVDALLRWCFVALMLCGVDALVLWCFDALVTWIPLSQLYTLFVRSRVSLFTLTKRRRCSPAIILQFTLPTLFC